MKIPKLLILVLLLIIAEMDVSSAAIFADKSAGSNPQELAIVTYVSNNIQERAVRSFIQSVRERAGSYSNAIIYVVLGDRENFPCTSLEGENIVLVPIQMDSAFMEYPLAIKAFAAAQIEELVKANVKTLAWFDPATLVLGSLKELDLGTKYKVAVRPVSLLNTIGLSPGSKPDDYWTPIYFELGLNYKKVPSYITIVDEKDIQAYFNCEIFSVDPSLGIMAEWARVLSKLIKDKPYQEEVCNTPLKSLFLHQAVLSAVIISKTEDGMIKPLSITASYPFNQHEQLSEQRRIEKLNKLSAIIFDYAWERDPKWIDKIEVDQLLKEWLKEVYLDYLQVEENLYRIEGSCNSYLIITSEGSVLIDPAGANIAPEYFKSVINQHPLNAILLTHAHQDHWENLEYWRTDLTIPIITQREFTEYIDYRERLEQFYSRRGAIWARKPIPATFEAQAANPPNPTITFTDEYTFESGGIRFIMTHTPGETPDHTTIFIPELEAVLVGDNYYEYFINNATLRGTSTRPILGYINALSLALSYDPDYFLPGHGAPVVSKKNIQETVGNFHDVLQYIFDKTIQGINEGKDVYTLMSEICLPDKYSISPYFGKVEWTVRGIYHEYIGWFDENTSSMYSLPPSAIFPDLIEITGIEPILAKANELFELEEYVKLLHLSDVILKVIPDNQYAKEIRIKALEAIKTGPYNYIEHLWLDYGIRNMKE